MSKELVKLNDFGLLTFGTTTQALKAEKVLQRAGAEFLVIPVPREVSASCGLAVKTRMENLPGQRELLQQELVRVEAAYHIRPSIGLKSFLRMSSELLRYSFSQAHSVVTAMKPRYKRKVFQGYLRPGVLTARPWRLFSAAANGTAHQQYRHRDEQVKCRGGSRCLCQPELCSRSRHRGKSLLIFAAILWTLESGEKVVISTRTRCRNSFLNVTCLILSLASDYRVAEAKGRKLPVLNQYSILAGKQTSMMSSSILSARFLHGRRIRNRDRKELKLRRAHASLGSGCQPAQLAWKWLPRQVLSFQDAEKATDIDSQHSLLLSDLMVDNSTRRVPLPDHR